MKKHRAKKRIGRPLAALLIAAGFVIFCAAGLLAVDSGMRAALFCDPAPAFSVSAQGGLHLRLFGQQLTLGEGLLSGLSGFLLEIVRCLRILPPAVG